MAPPPLVRLALPILPARGPLLPAVARFTWLWGPAALYAGLPRALRAPPPTSSVALEAVVDMTCGTVFIPVVGILYAILVGLSIETLWARQQEGMAALSAECARAAMLWQQLAVVFQAVPGAPAADAAFAAYGAYAGRLLELLDRGTVDGAAKGLEDLHTLAEALSRSAEDVGALGSSTTSDAFTAAMSEVAELAVQRAEHATSVRMRLPAAHWGVLGGLASSLVFAFWLVASGPVEGLAEAGRASAIVAAPRLRAMLSLLVGSLGCVFKLLVDLQRPFSGVYRVRRSEASSAARLLERAVAAVDERRATLGRAR